MKFAQAVKLRSTARSPLELLRRMRKLYDDPKTWVKEAWLTSDSFLVTSLHFFNGETLEKEVYKDLYRFSEDEMRAALHSERIPPTANVAFCLDGACAFVNGEHEETARKFLKMAIAQYDPLYLVAHYGNFDLENDENKEFIYTWNDANARSIKDVRAVLDIAITIAKKFAKAGRKY